MNFHKTLLFLQKGETVKKMREEVRIKLKQKHNLKVHYVRISVENIKNVIEIPKRLWKTVLLAVSMLTS